MTWIRLGLASAVLLAGSAGVLVGCSDDEADNPPTKPKTDGGSDGVAPPPPDGAPPTDGPAPDAPSTSAPKILIVHAAPGLPAGVRFCMKVGTVFPIDEVLPTAEQAPNGIPYGAGANLTEKIPADRAALLPSVDITPIAVPADKTGKCSDLFKSGTPDFAVTLTTIPQKTLVAGKTYIAAVVGCKAGDTGGAAKCGSDYGDGGASNARLALVELNKTPPTATNASGFQFYHLSPQLQSMEVLIDDAGTLAKPFQAGIVPGWFRMVPVDSGASDAGGDADLDAGDASAATDAMTMETHRLGTGSFIYDPAFGKKFAPDPVDKLSPDPTAVPGVAGNTNWKLGVWTAGGPDHGGPQMAIDITKVIAATVGMNATGGLNEPGLNLIQNGKNYTLVAIGNPKDNLPDGGFASPYFFRVIALPND